MHQNTMPTVNSSVQISSRMQRLFSNFDRGFLQLCLRSRWQTRYIFTLNRSTMENLSSSTLIAFEALSHTFSDLWCDCWAPTGMAEGTRDITVMKSILMGAADFFWTANKGNKVDSFKRCCANWMNVNGHCKWLRGVDSTLRHIMMPFTTLQEWGLTHLCLSESDQIVIVQKFSAAELRMRPWLSPTSVTPQSMPREL